MATIRVDTKELEKLIAQLRDAPKVMRELVRKTLEASMRKAAGIAKKNVTNPDSSPGLTVRTGRLRASIRHEVRVEDQNLVGVVGVENVPYAAVQEYGTKGKGGFFPTIVPKPPGKVLTIPLDAAKTASGVARFTAREAKEAYPEGTFWENPEGGSDNPVLFGKKGKKLVPLFVGVPRVDITPKHFLRDAITAVEGDFRERLLDGIVTQLIREGGRPGG